MSENKGIVIITGKLAYREAVNQAEIIRRMGYNVIVVKFNVDIAMFINERMISSWLKRNCEKVSNHVIILPGKIPASTENIRKHSNCGKAKIVRGPVHISDLSYYLKEIPVEKWSAEEPVDNIWLSTKEKIVEEAYNSSLTNGDGIRSMYSKITIPIRPPPFIPAAELYVDSKIGEKLLFKKINKLLKNKYPIIVVGSTENNTEKIIQTIQIIEKEGYNGILGIDAKIDRELIQTILNKTSVELLLSISSNEFNYMKRKNLIKIIRDNLIPVLIPTNHSSTIKGRYMSLIRIIKASHSIGLDRIIADPIMPVPCIEKGGLLNIMNTASKIGRKYNVPTMLGLSNYTELVDVDSPGIVFTLTQISVEAGISLGLFSEESIKTQGVFIEALKSAKMISYAYSKRIPPKDIGVNLLLLKDKKLSKSLEVITVEIIGNASKEGPVGRWDPMGSFNIISDPINRFVYLKKKTWDKWIASDNWRSLVDYIIEHNEVNEIGHAFYLGKEIYKAILASKLFKDYVQDSPLFSIKE